MIPREVQAKHSLGARLTTCRMIHRALFLASLQHVNCKACTRITRFVVLLILQFFYILINLAGQYSQVDLGCLFTWTLSDLQDMNLESPTGAKPSSCQGKGLRI